MSVILDALRRSRKRETGGRSGPAPQTVSANRPIPTGLGLGVPHVATGLRPARTRWLGLAAFLPLLVIRVDAPGPGEM